MTTLKKGHLGYHPVGQTVCLGEWSFRGNPAGMVVPREPGPYPPRCRIIGNYAGTTGVVVVEHEITKARTEHDAYTPVTHYADWWPV